MGGKKNSLGSKWVENGQEMNRQVLKRRKQRETKQITNFPEVGVRKLSVTLGLTALV